METAMMFVAGGAVALAIVVAVVNKMKSSAKTKEPTGFAPMGVPSVKPREAAPPMPPKKKRANKRGWKAPIGHYFNDDDELITDSGSVLVDLVFIAQLCGEEWAPPVEAVEGAAPVEAVSAEACTTSASCCSEASASSEVTSTSDFGSLQTAPTRPEPSYSAPEASSDSGGGCDSGGDSGGDD